MDINKLAEKTVELICKEYQLRWPKGVLRPMVELIQDAIEEAVADCNSDDEEEEFEGDFGHILEEE